MGIVSGSHGQALKPQLLFSRVRTITRAAINYLDPLILTWECSTLVRRLLGYLGGTDLKVLWLESFCLCLLLDQAKLFRDSEADPISQSLTFKSWLSGSK